MERYFLVRFNGCLNKKRKKINLLLLHGVGNAVLSAHNLEHYLYTRRGKRELGPKNGPGTSGYLEVILVHEQKVGKLIEECKLLNVCNESIPGIYKQIKNDLKLEIKDKVFDKVLSSKLKGGNFKNGSLLFREKKKSKKVNTKNNRKFNY
ncbi:MAG: hypothetical protein PHH35_01770 [Candidatus Pacebacteria bacterium]|nr:hypothetical protein [Candidatus Paceibacterota bacterium]